MRDRDLQHFLPVGKRAIFTLKRVRFRGGKKNELIIASTYPLTFFPIFFFFFLCPRYGERKIQRSTAGRWFKVLEHAYLSLCRKKETATHPKTLITQTHNSTPLYTGNSPSSCASLYVNKQWRSIFPKLKTHFAFVHEPDTINTLANFYTEQSGDRSERRGKKLWDAYGSRAMLMA